MTYELITDPEDNGEIGDDRITEIQHLEQRIESLRAEMPNMTGRERNTQRRLINELIVEIIAIRKGD